MSRRIAAHAPYPMDLEVVKKVQLTFLSKYKETASNRLRGSKDVQMAFMYNNALPYEGRTYGIEKVQQVVETKGMVQMTSELKNIIKEMAYVLTAQPRFICVQDDRENESENDETAA
jgi:hypothetical protein